MSVGTPIVLSATDRLWPVSLTERMGASAPSTLDAVGPLKLLQNPRTALFCSAETPGIAILRAHDAARRMRDEGKTVISGFHSPLEKECLRILLRGQQPIIICPARAIATIRIPADCRSAFESGRLLFVSAFAKQPARVTRATATRRNEIVAAMADEAFIAHIAPGGNMEHIANLLQQWGVPINT
jgi:predicted Rossmann fold nucleotide-binding protein DprA/Smf involved in DNA uptake